MCREPMPSIPALRIGTRLCLIYRLQADNSRRHVWIIFVSFGIQKGVAIDMHCYV